MRRTGIHLSNRGTAFGARWANYSESNAEKPGRGLSSKLLAEWSPQPLPILGAYKCCTRPVSLPADPSPVQTSRWCMRQRRVPISRAMVSFGALNSTKNPNFPPVLTGRDIVTRGGVKLLHPPQAPVTMNIRDCELEVRNRIAAENRGDHIDPR